ncbi:Hpt domain-containing protein [Desulfobulbus propionicus]|jgi:HPt (histidine-containing phosphotransfer) domain-containing protein
MDEAAYLGRIRNHLQTAYLLSEEKIETMMPIFLATLHAHMNRLAELAANGDLDQLGQASHAVKGALLNIGLHELAETAYAIEKQCKTGGHLENCQKMITELQSTVSRFSGEW